MMKIKAAVTTEKTTCEDKVHEFIVVEFSVRDGGKFRKIGEVELYYNDDTINGTSREFTEDEWTLSLRKGEGEETDIIMSGHVTPSKDETCRWTDRGISTCKKPAVHMGLCEEHKNPAYK